MTKVACTVSAPVSKTPKLKGVACFASLGLMCAFSSASAQVQGPVAHHPLHGGGYTATSANSPASETGTPVLQQPASSGKPSATTPANTVAAPTVAVSQFLEPPKQAVIEAQANNLTIRADNASLTQTLQRIADKTGMQLEGIAGDQRVFGNFGPGTPRDVLSVLLTGTGYNILMIGALDNGAPRQLILSQKKADSTAAHGAARQQQDTPPPDDDSSDAPADDPPPPMAPPHGGMDGTGPGVRTPQQMLQQMQQMRQQADQQQANQPQ